ncbi:carbohydrate ABC transporter permease [Lacrimispora celerecrescens]|jgi:putative aldouronate transport system permease protein|uniref:Sugar ABC transporter permease n=1 Tax=Lacrimispora celerecrescens TaxID=29354 RepID=A0A084JFB9_9FIRM|nr:carbohydrate ABC transporter permease [Lacrimispora celerecrescens]KEZ87653.1 sugar ABC transporter permease [Lacrimispora celerecrescens]
MKREDMAFSFMVYVLLTFVLIIIAFPLIYLVSASFSSPQAVISGRVWLLPVDFTIKGYEAIFKDSSIIRGFLNSLYITVVGTGINILMTVMMAYPISRKKFYGRKAFTMFMMITMFFGGGLVPTFLLINHLHMYNTFWAVMVPGCVGITNVIICRTYFESSIPEELYESASLDGCDDFGFLIRIVLPLSKPVLAVLVLYYAVGHWNSYFNEMIYLEDKVKYPLQVVLRQILIMSQVADEMMLDFSAAEQAQGMADLLKYSTIVVSSLPMLILYPFIQKYFVKGVMIGSVKG